MLALTCLSLKFALKTRRPALPGSYIVQQIYVSCPSMHSPQSVGHDVVRVRSKRGVITRNLRLWYANVSRLIVHTRDELVSRMCPKSFRFGVAGGREALGHITQRT
jgi:hypothetical protein